MRRRAASRAPANPGERGARKPEAADAETSVAVGGAPRALVAAEEGDRAAGRRRPTMTDVARIAGVSQTGVSLILNRMKGARISEATRQRVAEAAREIGYELP